MRAKTNSTGPVAITGMGILTPFGYGIDAFLNALQANQCAIDFITADTKLSLPLNIGAAIKNFDYKRDLSAINTSNSALLTKALHLGHRAPVAIQAALLAGIEAWQYAKLHEWESDPERVAVIVAGNNTTTALSHQSFHLYEKTPEYLSPSYAVNFLDTNHVGYLSELFTIRGEGYTVGGASASGNVAIIHAARLVQSAVVDICMVVGALAELSVVELQALRNINVLGGIKFAEQPQAACRPFDTQHEGFIPGQASACLIVESEKSAATRGVSVIGRFLGGSLCLDAKRTPDPSMQGETAVMNSVIKQAGLTINEIDYINTHGTSSILGDDTEVEAIQMVCGKNSDKIWLNSTKSIVGHCLWSAGVVEAIATLLQLNHNFLHGNLNLEHPINAFCQFVSKRGVTATLTHAISNSFGFGGINSSIILQRGEN